MSCFWPVDTVTGLFHGCLCVEVSAEECFQNIEVKSVKKGACWLQILNIYFQES